MSVRSMSSQPFEHLLEAAGQRVAEVAVADDGVEVAEVLLVVDGGLRDRAHDELDCGWASVMRLSFVAAGCSASAARRCRPAGRRA